MDLEKVLAFLKEKEASEDVVDFVKGLKTVSTETVKDYLENNEEGKKLLNTLTDQRVTKGIETFKTNNLQKLLDEEIAKKFPDETEDAKKQRQLIERLSNLENEIKKKDLLTSAIKKAGEKGLPLAVIERLLGDDEETTEKNLNLFETEFKKAIEAQVNEKFKAGGRDIPGHPNPITPENKETSALVKDLLNQV